MLMYNVYTKRTLNKSRKTKNWYFILNLTTERVNHKTWIVEKRNIDVEKRWID